MIASARKVYIQRMLEEKGIVSVKEVASEIGLSEITISRDFEKMEAAGLLRRVRGGAIGPNAELTMNRKKDIFAAEKAKVAKAAADLVNDGECIFLDAGTSVAEMMEFLKHKRISIVTYSGLIINRVTKPVAADIFLLGGRYIPGYSIFTGEVAVSELEKCNFDRAFIGCTCVDVNQRVCYATDEDSIEIKNIAMKKAEKNYLLLDSSKLGRRALMPIDGTDCFDQVICNQAETGDYPQNFHFV